MKILIAEDDRAMRDILATLFTNWGYEVLAAQDGEDAVRLLSESKSVQVAVLDWMMPKMDGIEVCRWIRESRNEPYTYILLLTSRDAREDLIQGMEAGADDYLVKPIHPDELQVRIRAAQRIVDLQAKLLAAQESLRIQATHDSLTGVWNRRALFDIMAKEIGRAHRQNETLSLVMIDLDHFKQVNDTWGHVIGDDILHAVAERLVSIVRTHDTVGRYGGEEFMIVMPGYDSRAAQLGAERLRRVFADEAISVAGRQLVVTLSIGVITLEPGQKAELASLVAAADCAVYEAKKRGRNRTVVGSL